ncbi:hypothetical protein F2Q69_00028974 [Brassica cretica]|uniref:Uncharacterized protein n=1 Tax=Brassica cretica TaxID=69181 RepID=A0A8S9S290_BRACR|nr:hypothetical protein F2Q69_00028974 [Brassica cretica]
MSEMDFELPSSGVHQDMVNLLGWEDAGVEQQNLSGSEFEQFCLIPKVVSIDARLMMSIGAQLLMSIDAQLLLSVDTSTSCLYMDIELSTRKASSSSFSCSSTSPKSLSEMALTWCLSLSTAFPLTRASCFFTASIV